MCGKKVVSNCKICKEEIEEASGCCRDGSKIRGFCYKCSKGIYTNIFNIWCCDGMQAVCSYWIEDELVDKKTLIRDLRYTAEYIEEYYKDEEVKSEE